MSLDLCSTCRFLIKCMFKKDKLQSVNSCEEFETEVPLSRVQKNRSIQSEKDAKKLQATTHKITSAAEFMGLCINCIKNKACSFPKREGGVWHCEEYL